MIFALLGALVIGISLGLLGSGGSILTVPVLIYILHHPEKLAIAESLAIVGIIALMAAIPYGMRNEIHWKSVLLFGIPGMFGAYFGACGSSFISGPLQLTFFACVMFVVAGMMLFGPTSFEKKRDYASSNGMIIGEGFLVGCLTGLLGCGGGFIIVPALILLFSLSMSLAIGTSLVIIALNSFTGFTKHLIALDAMSVQVDWFAIFILSIAGILGSFAGKAIAGNFSQVRLRQLFGVSVFVMGSYILIRQMGNFY